MPPPRKLDSDGTLPSMLRRDPAGFRDMRDPPLLGGPLLGGPSDGGRGGRCGDGTGGLRVGVGIPPDGPPAGGLERAWAAPQLGSSAAAAPARSALLLLRARLAPACATLLDEGRTSEGGNVSRVGQTHST